MPTVTRLDQITPGMRVIYYDGDEEIGPGVLPVGLDVYKRQVFYTAYAF